jgi:Flp pilus assembly protein TadG
MKQSNKAEKGASAVEMAMVAPFLLILLLGIIEFGYVFGQYNEVRHAAREGARFAAVSNTTLDTDSDGDIDATDIKNTVCGAIDLSNSNIEIEVDLVGTNAIGQNAEVTVTAYIQSLTGAPLISSFVPDDLENVATFRLEQKATWTDQTFGNSSTSAC